MLKKLLLLSSALAITGLLFESSGSSQGDSAAFKNNRCVDCHSGISSPLSISSRYLDWHVSAHRKGGVGCEKCHGGDPTTRDLQKAHKGVLPSSQIGSRIHQASLPETCGACHSVIANAFIESTHYQRLKSSGLGPSCNTCHGHMGLSVTTHPSEAATFCTFCHNAINGTLPKRPDIPQKAQKVMESIGRANYIVIWVGELLNEAAKRKIDATEQAEDMRLLRGLLNEAKVAWHVFNLDGVQTKADKAFEEGVRIRDQLMKKLREK